MPFSVLPCNDNTQGLWAIQSPPVFGLPRAACYVVAIFLVWWSGQCSGAGSMHYERAPHFQSLKLDVAPPPLRFDWSVNQRKHPFAGLSACRTGENLIRGDPLRRG